MEPVRMCDRCGDRPAEEDHYKCWLCMDELVNTIPGYDPRNELTEEAQERIMAEVDRDVEQEAPSKEVCLRFYQYDREPAPDDLVRDGQKWAHVVEFDWLNALRGMAGWMNPYPGMPEHFFLDELSGYLWDISENELGVNKTPEAWPQELKDYYFRLREYEHRDCPMLK